MAAILGFRARALEVLAASPGAQWRCFPGSPGDGLLKLASCCWKWLSVSDYMAHGGYQIYIYIYIYIYNTQIHETCVLHKYKLKTKSLDNHHRSTHVGVKYVHLHIQGCQIPSKPGDLLRTSLTRDPDSQHLRDI